MKTDLAASIAGTNLCFDGFGKGGFWEMWQWKLDPYRVSGKADVTVCNAASGETDDEEGKLLHSEISGFFRRDVLGAPDGSTIWRFVWNLSDEVVLQYRLSADCRKVELIADRTNSAGMVAFEYLNQLMPGILLKHDVLTFHGVLLEHEGMCFAVCADSGVGKSTHARLWRDRKNALILNGDRTLLRKREGVWHGYGSPWSGTSGEQVCRSAPLKAIVILKRGEENRVERLNCLDSLTGALAHVLYPGWDGDATNKAMELLDGLLTEIPVYGLHCRPDGEAVQVLYDAIYGDKNGN